MPMFDYTVIDIGSTYTKQRVFDGHRLVASAQTPTTLGDVRGAIGSGREMLRAQLGADPASGQTLASSSAAGGLRMVAMGFMARVTARAAKEVAMNSGAKILEVLSAEDPPGYRVQVLREIKPDIVLLAGGTDFGDENSLLENARVIAESSTKAMVILAGNTAVQPAAAAILAESGVPHRRVANIMPTIHTLDVAPARAAIHREFIRQITRAQGLSQLQRELSSEQVLPTPGAVLLAAELLAKGVGDEEGLGSLMVVDLGGATTDVHSVIPAYEELAPEEIGLIVGNAKHVSSRTVEGNLGMRVSAASLVQTADPRAMLIRRGVRDPDMEERLTAYSELLERSPSHLPQNEEEHHFDTVIAETAVALAVRRHAGYIVTEPDPVLGLPPGMPVGRDLREVHTVIAVGGIFAHRSEAEGKAIVESALRGRGTALLPEWVEVIIDADYLLFAGGVIGMQDRYYAFEMLRQAFIDRKNRP